MTYSKELIKKHFGLQEDYAIDKKEFLHILLVPNITELENMDLLVRLKDNKI